MNARASITRADKPNSEAKTGRARQRLLEAAGEVFATLGFDRATGKDICRRAGLNNAAINYYFGGMEGLCLAVMTEAQGRLVTLAKLQEAVAAQRRPKDQLKAIFTLLLTAAMNPPSDSWVLRVVIQQVLAPAPRLEAMAEKNILPRAAMLRRIVSEIMGLPADHPAVAAGCINVIAPCLVMLFYDKRLMRRAFPAMELAPEHARKLVETMCRYALAGLKAVAGQAGGSAARR